MRQEDEGGMWMAPGSAHDSPKHFDVKACKLLEPPHAKRWCTPPRVREAKGWGNTKKMECSLYLLYFFFGIFGFNHKVKTKSSMQLNRRNQSEGQLTFPSRAPWLRRRGAS